MTKPRRYLLRGHLHTAVEIRAMMKPMPSIGYVRNKLNKLKWTAQQVIETPVLQTHKAKGQKAAKASPWGAENYRKVMGGAK